ncbi:SPOC like C-terminal domain-containing protein [Trichoderma austrokoningii]
MADKQRDWKREDNDEDEDGEQELDESSFKAQKDAVLLAIEVSPSMLEPPPASDSKKADQDSPLQAALKCAHHLMEQRIISNPKDMMGILLFGTEKTKFRDDKDGRGGLGYPNCYLFTDLDVPAADDVKALRALVEEEEDEGDVLKPATTDVVSMSNVLFCANQIFTTKAANFGSRRLFIVTDNDDPHASDKAARSAAAVRAKDLYDLGIIIDLFPIAKGDSPFDLGKFYDDIVYRDVNAEANATEVRTSKSGDGLSLLNSLISNINSKQSPKRALFHLPFEIAPGLRITVKGYNVVSRQAPARTCYIWLDGEKAQIATGETTRIAEDSARTVEKQEIKKAYKFGGEYVYFTPEEQKTIRDYGPPVIRIIGFKNRNLIPVWASVKKSTFIFPSEEDYIGSSRVFSALWQKLLDSEKIGIAWCVLRSNSQPVLAAVIPSREQSDEASGTPYLSAGLWICPLPTADDLRDVSAERRLDCSEDLKTKMRVIVQQLNLPKGVYNPLKYPNPALQWHYKILQTLALDEEVPDKPEDLTEPKNKAINKRAGGYLENWAETLKDEADRAVRSQSLKREIEEDDASGRPAKQRKAAADRPSGSTFGMAQLKAAVESEGLSKMTVVQLKDVAGAKGLSTSGKKADLVERIEQWVEENS